LEALACIQEEEDCEELNPVTVDVLSAAELVNESILADRPVDDSTDGPDDVVVDEADDVNASSAATMDPGAASRLEEAGEANDVSSGCCVSPPSATATTASGPRPQIEIDSRNVVDAQPQGALPSGSHSSSTSSSGDSSSSSDSEGDEQQATTLKPASPSSPDSSSSSDMEDLPLSNLRKEPATKAKKADPEPIIKSAPDKENSASTKTANKEWACPACTYQNTAAKRKCQLCDTKRPPLAQKRR
jgi:hypothetical protein